MNNLISACEYNAEQVAMQWIQYSQTLKKRSTMTSIVVVRMSVTENIQTVHRLRRHSLAVSCATV